VSWFLSFNKDAKIWEITFHKFVDTIANTLLARKALLPAGLPDFSWYKIPKQGKIYQMATKYTNGHKIFPIAVK
jgi:hypothetical protein